MTSHKINTEFINNIYDDDNNDTAYAIAAESVKEIKIAKINVKIDSINDIIDELKIRAQTYIKNSMAQIKKDRDDDKITDDDMINRIIIAGQKFEAIDKIIQMKEKRIKTLNNKKATFVLD